MVGEVSRMGGWDNERLIRLYYLDQDPEYINYNVNFTGSNYASGWINYTEGGGTSDDPSETESIDLTPYAGEIIDIRFRFRSGLEGTVGLEALQMTLVWMDSRLTTLLFAREMLNLEMSPMPAKNYPSQISLLVKIELYN